MMPLITALDSEIHLGAPTVEVTKKPFYNFFLNVRESKICKG